MEKSEVIKSRVALLDEATLNLVPSDFVVGAIDHLSGLPHSAGRTYQLADPDPCTVSETVTLIGEACGRNLIPCKYENNEHINSLNY